MSDSAIIREADDVAQLVAAAYAADVLRTEHRPRREMQDRTWATGRRKCNRQMALDLTHSADDDSIDAYRLAAMIRGQAREREIIAKLSLAGGVWDPPFAVEAQQKWFSITERGRQIITGKIDGKLSFRHLKRKPPFDVKAWSNIRSYYTVGDLLANKWAWAAVWQIAIYCYSEGEPYGFLILDTPGLPRLIPIVIEPMLGEIEAFLQQADVAYAVRHEHAALPDFTDNPALCHDCPHLGKSCVPPKIDMGAGVHYISDEELEALAESVHANREPHLAFERSHRALKTALRPDKGVDARYMVGRFLCSVTWNKGTVYELPEEVEAQIEDLRLPYKKTDPHAKCMGPTVEKVEDEAPQPAPAAVAAVPEPAKKATRKKKAPAC